MPLHGATRELYLMRLMARVVLGVRVFSPSCDVSENLVYGRRVGRDAKTCRFRVPTFRASDVHEFFLFVS